MRPNILILIWVIGYTGRASASLLYSSVWPLSNNTLGYDVLFNRRTAELNGLIFMSGPGSELAYQLNGTTYADINIELTSALIDGWSFIMYLFYSKDGHLCEYNNNINQTVFGVTILNRQLNLYFPKSSINPVIVSSLLPLNSWLQFSIGQDIDSGDLVVNIDDAEVKRDKHFSPGSVELTAGTLRMGRWFTVPEVDFVGGISCIRYYTLAVEHNQMDEAASHCDRLDALWTYHGPYGCMWFKCKNGATCRDNESPDYICDCAADFTGNDCETKIDDCQPEPCLNQGMCIDDIASYQCLCGPDFTGKRCEVALDKKYDSGYFVLHSREKGPDDVSSMASLMTSNARQCGDHCVRVPGCVSFTVNPITNDRVKCTIYDDVRLPLMPSNKTKFYILCPLQLRVV